MSDAMPLSESVRALTLMKEALSILDHAGHLGVAAALQNAIDIAVDEIHEAADQSSRILGSVFFTSQK